MYGQFGNQETQQQTVWTNRKQWERESPDGQRSLLSDLVDEVLRPWRSSGSRIPTEDVVEVHRVDGQIDRSRRGGAECCGNSHVTQHRYKNTPVRCVNSMWACPGVGYKQLKTSLTRTGQQREKKKRQTVHGVVRYRVCLGHLPSHCTITGNTNILSLRHLWKYIYLTLTVHSFTFIC